MNKYLQMPKVLIGVVLFFLFLIVASLIGWPNALYLLIFCVGGTVLSDIAFTYLRRKKLFQPFAAVVTGLILTLIIEPSALWWQILIICIAAMAIKNFLRIKNRHVLNPAASGLLIGWVLFGLNPSWWGATLYSGDGTLILNILIYAALLGIAYVSCYKIGRYNTVLSYVVLYSILFLIVTGSFSVEGIFKTLVSPGMLFYALLMLPEPMTSPVTKKRQLMYGSLVAVLNAVIVFFTFRSGISNFPDSSILALLIGNAIFFRFR